MPPQTAQVSAGVAFVYPTHTRFVLPRLRTILPRVESSRYLRLLAVISATTLRPHPCPALPHRIAATSAAVIHLHPRPALPRRLAAAMTAIRPRCPTGQVIARRRRQAVVTGITRKLLIAAVVKARITVQDYGLTTDFTWNARPHRTLHSLQLPHPAVGTSPKDQRRKNTVMANAGGAGTIWTFKNNRVVNPGTYPAALNCTTMFRDRNVGPWECPREALCMRIRKWRVEDPGPSPFARHGESSARGRNRWRDQIFGSCLLNYDKSGERIEKASMQRCAGAYWTIEREGAVIRQTHLGPIIFSFGIRLHISTEYASPVVHRRTYCARADIARTPSIRHAPRKRPPSAAMGCHCIRTKEERRRLSRRESKAVRKKGAQHYLSTELKGFKMKRGGHSTGSGSGLSQCPRDTAKPQGHTLESTGSRARASNRKQD
ncbi:hypothetical protein FB451DRAFT_1491756 [Mycena latifolia]|nr:hypothetical protein FB451DRAFT_1491756 [Mycena latifolia]